jgi:hypothetical protein
MSIYASWPDIGEADDGELDGSVLSYTASHAYPDPATHRPGTVGISHIPGFIWRTGLPESRRDQDDDAPVAPYLRLDICNWDSVEGRPMMTGCAVLNRVAVERLRDDLAAWLEMEMHDR